MDDAVALYARQGFEVIETRLHRVFDTAFSDRCDVEHESVQLILRRPA